MICMIRTQKDETTVKKNRLEKFCRDLKNKIELKDKNENRHTAEVKNTGKPDERPRINDDDKERRRRFRMRRTRTNKTQKIRNHQRKGNETHFPNNKINI